MALVVCGCGNAGTTDIVVDRNSGRTFNISGQVLDACQLREQPLLESYEGAEDIIQLLRIDSRAGVSRQDALAGVLSGCSTLAIDLATLADCASCFEAMVDQAYGQ